MSQTLSEGLRGMKKRIINSADFFQRKADVKVINPFSKSREELLKDVGNKNIQSGNPFNKLVGETVQTGYNPQFKHEEEYTEKQIKEINQLRNFYKFQQPIKANEVFFKVVDSRKAQQEREQMQKDSLIKGALRSELFPQDPRINDEITTILKGIDDYQNAYNLTDAQAQILKDEVFKSDVLRFIRTGAGVTPAKAKEGLALKGGGNAPPPALPEPDGDGEEGEGEGAGGAAAGGQPQGGGGGDGKDGDETDEEDQGEGGGGGMIEQPGEPEFKEPPPPPIGDGGAVGTGGAAAGAGGGDGTEGQHEDKAGGLGNVETMIPTQADKILYDEFVLYAKDPENATVELPEVTQERIDLKIKLLTSLPLTEARKILKGSLTTGSSDIVFKKLRRFAENNAFVSKGRLTDEELDKMMGLVKSMNLYLQAKDKIKGQQGEQQDAPTEAEKDLFKEGQNQYQKLARYVELTPKKPAGVTTKSLKEGILTLQRLPVKNFNSKISATQKSEGFVRIYRVITRGILRTTAAGTKYDENELQQVREQVENMAFYLKNESNPLFTQGQEGVKGLRPSGATVTNPATIRQPPRTPPPATTGEGKTPQQAPARRQLTTNPFAMSFKPKSSNPFK